jgi:diguanylate cyclase (GGDEF)-like protein
VSDAPSIASNGNHGALQECGTTADATAVTPVSGTSRAAEAALASIVPLSRRLAEEVSLTALMLVDSDLVVREVQGAGWGRKEDLGAMIGRRLADVIPEELRDHVVAQYAAVVRDGQTHRFTFAYGEDYRATIMPVTAGDGSVAGCLCIVWDEGAALRAEREASAELSRRLAQQSAVARLGELALRRPEVGALTAAAHAAVADGLGADAGHVLEPAGADGLLRVSPAARGAFGERDLDFLTAVAHVLNSAVEGRLAEARIRHDAAHDALTGLPNRTLLLERLNDAVARADAEGRRIALFFLDVDHLKVLNDSLGHHAGDELLRAIGPRLRAVLREQDMIARFGGDEFAVLCEQIDDEGQALRVAERLVRAFAKPFEVCGEPRFCSTSVGVVVSDPEGTRGGEELLSDADAALYRAKERGRGRHEVFDAGMRDRMTARLRIEADLRRAIEAGDQLWVAYQPFFELPGGRIAGVEALLRWDHPEHGRIAPSRFIPVAEDSGLIVELGERVLRTASRQVARWQAETPASELRLTVNISARQMALDGLPGTVGAVLRETGLAPGYLGLEITEGMLLEETPATAETLQALQRLGLRLMLDDFGTGYSSLSYLRRYPLDVLKIDRAFVHDLGEDGQGDAAIVQAIVGMAKALGMHVIPEGVETAGQLARLTELGCDYAQGFHLARPLAAPDLEALLRRSSISGDEGHGPALRRPA